MPECSVTGCGKLVLALDLCAMHYRRLERGRPADTPAQEKLSPFARFVESAIALVEANPENDEAYDLAEDRLRVYAARWMRSLGWKPAAEQLADGVQRAVQTQPRGTGQQKSSAQERARAAIPQGRLGKSGRDAGLGEADARAGGKPRPGRDRAPGPADATEEVTARSPVRGGGAARPGGAEAVLPRAAQAGRRR